MPRLHRKRLTVDMPMDMHKELKCLCKFYNITITKMVLRLIKQRLLLQQQLDKKD
jgi:hypothetical protein